MNNGQNIHYVNKCSCLISFFFFKQRLQSLLKCPQNITWQAHTVFHNIPNKPTDHTHTHTNTHAHTHTSARASWRPLTYNGLLKNPALSEKASFCKQRLGAGTNKSLALPAELLALNADVFFYDRCRSSFALGVLSLGWKLPRRLQLWTLAWFCLSLTEYIFFDWEQHFDAFWIIAVRGSWSFRYRPGKIEKNLQ